VSAAAPAYVVGATVRSRFPNVPSCELGHDRPRSVTVVPLLVDRVRGIATAALKHSRRVDGDVPGRAAHDRDDRRGVGGDRALHLEAFSHPGILAGWRREPSDRKRRDAEARADVGERHLDHGEVIRAGEVVGALLPRRSAAARVTAAPGRASVACFGTTCPPSYPASACSTPSVTRSRTSVSP
jgi:hypothetical protein